MNSWLLECIPCYFILIGAGFLILSIIKSIRILKIVPKRIFNKWLLTILFIIFFLIGYLLVVIIVFIQVDFPLLLVTGFVFFGGAAFVYLIMSLSSTTIDSMDQKEKIDQLLTQKTQFLNQLGHDLKNPLGPLIQLLPILEKNETDPKKKEMISIALRNASYMKNLVSKTLELARLNSPNIKFHFISLSLKQEVDNIKKNNIYLLRKKNIILYNEVSENIMVHADKIRLEELFTNLINNAVKYSNDFGTIKINAKEKGDEIILSIRDDGIGMTELQLQNIFNEFYKVDESRHDFDSSGLGMSICKRIVEKHGGNIWVESEGLGRGSTFYFTLPNAVKKMESDRL